MCVHVCSLGMHTQSANIMLRTSLDWLTIVVRRKHWLAARMGIE